MGQINRRHLLASLSGGAVATVVSDEIAKATFAPPELNAYGERIGRQDGWLIAQQSVQACGEHAVKFWSMDWAPMHFAEHLPSQVSRGLIAHHDFGARTCDPHEVVDPLDRAFENCARKWIEPEQLDRFTLNLDVGVEDFLPLLTSFVGGKGTTKRTALVDIDSRTISGREIRWRHILPAFVRCYDFVIGLCHFEQRGLRQERARLDRIFGESHFRQNVLEPASLCDALIVTSAGLIESDTGLSSHASTEALVGELMRRLGHAMLTRKLLDRIVGPRGAKQRPRFFALSSATLNAPFEPILHLQMMLDRQSAFVSGSFDPLAVDELPLFIATSRDDDPDLWMPATDTFCRAAWMSCYDVCPDVFETVQAPRYSGGARWPGALDLITLWPFKVTGSAS